MTNASLSIIGQRAADIVRQNPGITISHLARMLDRTLSYVHRLTVDLEDVGFTVTQDRRLYPPTEAR